MPAPMKLVCDTCQTETLVHLRPNTWWTPELPGWHTRADKMKRLFWHCPQGHRTRFGKVESDQIPPIRWLPKKAPKPVTRSLFDALAETPDD